MAKAPTIRQPVTIYDENNDPVTFGTVTLDATALAALENITADTELPAARLAADSLALPTAPDVLATMMASATFDSGKLYLARIDSTAFDARDQGLLGLVVQSRGSAFNAATTWDRWRNNQAGTLLASAARTATVSSADQTNFNNNKLRAYINVTAIVSSPSVVFTIEVKDPISGVYTAILTSAAIVGTGHTLLTVALGKTVAANVAVSDFVGRTWRITATHGNADSITYSVGYDLGV